MLRRNWLNTIIIFLGIVAAFSVFGSEEKLTLTEAVEKALERNSRIYQADKNVEISKINFIRALGIALPKANIKYEYSHLHYREEQETTIELAGQSFTSTGPRDFDFNTATFNVVQPIMSGGRDWVLFFGAFDTVRLQKALSQQTRQEVVFDVKEAYFNVLSLRKLNEVMENSVRQMKEHLKIANAFFKQGMVVKTDVLSAELRLAAAKQNQIKIKNALKLARAALNFLIDEELEIHFSLVDELAAVDPLGVDYDESVELALRYRPQVQQMKSKLALDRKSIWIARADYFPSMNLFYTHKLEGGLMVPDDHDYWEETSDEESWIAGGVMELKLFNGGLTSADVKEAKINLNKTRRLMSDVIRNIKLEVLKAYSNVDESIARQDVTRKSEMQAKENFRIVHLQYKAGMAQSINVMEAHTTYLNAQTEALSATFDYQLALAELEKAVGLPLEEGEFVHVSK